MAADKAVRMTGELAGSLRERVVLERRLGGRDALGGGGGRYAYIGEAWAALSPIAPGNLTAGESIRALPRWRVTLRKRDFIDPSVRLVWRGKFLAVRAVVSDPREPSQMMLTCEEIA